MTDQNNQLVVQNKFALARQLDDNTWNAIKEIYDGASDEKVGLVIDYCKARKLDPLKKPVHIVPVWSNRRKMIVETLWPSVSEVRITAMRTGLFGGQSATEFGPDITRKVGNVEITFPEFAMVTVFRLVNGTPQPFPGPKCRWMETYSNRGKDDASPNAMWTKRPYAQLEKCAEAAALRRAFPEEGSYTAEEMHGKDLDETEPLNVTPAEQQQPAPVQRAEPKARKGAAAAKEAAKEVVVEQEPASTQAAEPAKTEPKNVTPEPVAPEPAKPAAPVVTPRAFLKDGEIIECVVEVISAEARNAPGADGKQIPSVLGTVKGDFCGPVRHLGGGEVVAGKTVPQKIWTPGNKLNVKLRGELSPAKKGEPKYGLILVWADSVEEVTQEF